MNNLNYNKIIYFSISFCVSYHIGKAVRDICTDNNRSKNQIKIDNYKASNQIELDNNRAKNKIEIDSNRAKNKIKTYNSSKLNN